MNDNRPFRILDDIAKDYIPDQADLVPRLAARLERKTFVSMIRTRPILLIVTVLLILFALSGVAYALGRSLGYIPGVGIVSREVPIRVLAEPVSLSREGVTISVEKATLSADKTVVLFRLDGISTDKALQDVTQCEQPWGELKLPDGSPLPAIGGYGVESWDTGFASRYTFAAVPADRNEAIFVPPCLSYYLPGTLPEDWSLTLHFIPTHPNLTVVPVLEITPSQAVPSENPMVLEKVIETEKGYILAGTFHSTGLPPNVKAINFSTWPKMTDASGQEVPYTFANYELDLPFEQKEAGVFSWAFEIEGKSFTWPLTITLDTVGVEYQDVQSQFEFDTGPNPQDGQVWENLNIEFEIAGHPVRVRNVVRIPDGYMFNFESLSATVFQGVDITIGDSLPALSGRDSPSWFSSQVSFAGEIPSGKLTVIVTRPQIDLPGVWQLQWQPESVSATPTP